VDDSKLVAMLSNALGTGGGLAVAMLVLWRVLSRMVERWIAALDRISDRVDVHTRTDQEYHAEVKEEIIRLAAKFDERHRERTPESIPVQRSGPASERRRLRTVPSGHRVKTED
jgi:hypothetical protein